MVLNPLNPREALNHYGDTQIFKSTSAFAYQSLSQQAIETLCTGLEAAPALSCPPSQPSMVQLLGGGGVPSRVPTDATAVFHRKARFLVQYDAYWTAPEDGPPTIDWLTNLRSSLLDSTTGAYVNYADEQIEDCLVAYYGANLARLIDVKRTYDPDNLFNFPQSIPLNFPSTPRSFGAPVPEAR
jgi:FAD/FMN-containing dehydrogenase